MAAARSPALAASALLHGGLLLAVLFAVRHAPPLAPPPPRLEEATAVTAVADLPPAAKADVRPAVAAPEPATARSPAPEPAPAPTPAPDPPALRPAPVRSAAPPPPPPPVPVPRPVLRQAPPPKPAPRPKPAPALDLNALARSLPAERRPQAKPLDLAALAASLPRNSRPAAKPLDLDALAASLPAGRGGGAPGPARAEAARTARPAVGAATGLSSDTSGALRAKIQPRWNLNCELDGADTVAVRVRFSVDSAGQLLGAPATASVTGQASEAVKAAFSRGAESAVRNSAPFTEVPPDQRRFMNPVTVTFNAAQACRYR